MTNKQLKDIPQGVTFDLPNLFATGVGSIAKQEEFKLRDSATPSKVWKPTDQKYKVRRRQARAEAEAEAEVASERAPA